MGKSKLTQHERFGVYTSDTLFHTFMRIVQHDSDDVGEVKSSEFKQTDIVRHKDFAEIKPKTIQLRLQALRNLGLIEILPNEKDKRKVVYRRTKDGLTRFYLTWVKQEIKSKLSAIEINNNDVSRLNPKSKYCLLYLKWFPESLERYFHEVLTVRARFGSFSEAFNFFTYGLLTDFDELHEELREAANKKIIDEKTLSIYEKELQEFEGNTTVLLLIAQRVPENIFASLLLKKFPPKEHLDKLLASLKREKQRKTKF